MKPTQPPIYSCSTVTETQLVQVLKRRLHQLTEFTGVNVLAFQKILKKRAKSAKKGHAVPVEEASASIVCG